MLSKTQIYYLVLVSITSVTVDLTITSGENALQIAAKHLMMFLLIFFLFLLFVLCCLGTRDSGLTTFH
jgi:hypothetical protein